MSKKKLNIDNIANELEGASLFFQKPVSPPSQENPTTEMEINQIPESPTEKESPVQIEPLVSEQNEVPRQTSTNKGVTEYLLPVNERKAKESRSDSMHASINASKHSLNQESIIETIRKAVKFVGKESATYRFTPEEKKALLELSFSFKMQGYKTSENELTRIAINFILEDQKQNGRNSVLQKVLEALSK